MSTKIIVDTYFDNIESKIKYELRTAKESIWICVAWISFRSYQEILLQKLNEGVDLRILCNGDIINHKNLNNVHYKLLRSVLLIRNPISAALIHHKFCVIDSSTVITGSFNWSDAAYYHYENIVVIKNDYKVVNRFKHEFCDLYYMAHHANNGIHFPKLHRSTSNFVLGMISEPHGIYENVTLQQWDVDISTNCCDRMGSVDFQHFYNHISTGLDDSDDDDYGYSLTKDYHIDQFNRIRKKMAEVQRIFEFKGIKVNAIGRAIKVQENMYDDEEPLIDILWIDVRYRKIVPNSIDIDGDFETVFDEAYFAGT